LPPDVFVARIAIVISSRALRARGFNWKAA
jgi:hypothetical protein